MINFCEDCGAKNTLGAKQFSDGKAVFKCVHCGYQNAYVMDRPQKNKLEKINFFLEKQLSNPIIMGAFIFHIKKSQVLINHMPSTLKEADLTILGKLLTDSLICCQKEYMDINELTLRIAEKRLMVQIINQDTVVVFVTKTKPLSEKIKQQFSDLISTL